MLHPRCNNVNLWDGESRLIIQQWSSYMYLEIVVNLMKAVSLVIPPSCIELSSLSGGMTCECSVVVGWIVFLVLSGVHM